MNNFLFCKEAVGEYEPGSVILLDPYLLISVGTIPHYSDMTFVQIKINQLFSLWSALWDYVDSMLRFQSSHSKYGPILRSSFPCFRHALMTFLFGLYYHNIVNVSYILSTFIPFCRHFVINKVGLACRSSSIYKHVIDFAWV